MATPYDSYIKKAVGFRPSDPVQEVDPMDGWDPTPDNEYQVRNGEQPVVSMGFQPPRTNLVSWNAPQPPPMETTPTETADDAEEREFEQSKRTAAAQNAARTQATPQQVAPTGPPPAKPMAFSIPQTPLVSGGKALEMGGWTKPENEATPKELADKRAGALAMAGIDAKAADARDAKVKGMEAKRQSLAAEWDANNEALNAPGASAGEKYNALATLARIDPQQFGAQFEKMRNNAGVMGSVNDERTAANIQSKQEAAAAAAEQAAQQQAAEEARKDAELKLKGRKADLEEQQFAAGEKRADKQEVRELTKEERRQFERAEDINRSDKQRLEDRAEAERIRIANIEAQDGRENRTRAAQLIKDYKNDMKAERQEVLAAALGERKDSIGFQSLWSRFENGEDVITPELQRKANEELQRRATAKAQDYNEQAAQFGIKPITFQNTLPQISIKDIGWDDSFEGAYNTTANVATKAGQVAALTTPIGRVATIAGNALGGAMNSARGPAGFTIPGQ